MSCPSICCKVKCCKQMASRYHKSHMSVNTSCIFGSDSRKYHRPYNKPINIHNSCASFFSFILFILSIVLPLLYSLFSCLNLSILVVIHENSFQMFYVIIIDVVGVIKYVEENNLNFILLDELNSFCISLWILLSMC